MLETIAPPTLETFTVRRASAAGYRFDPLPEGRVQLIAPDGQPAGNFASESAAAQSANFATDALTR